MNFVCVRVSVSLAIIELVNYRERQKERKNEKNTHTKFQTKKENA